MPHPFFELIQVAIGNATCLSHSPSEDEWESLFLMAQKQALVGVCFHGLQSLDKQQLSKLSSQLKMKWLSTALMIQQRNLLINYRCKELQETLSNDGFRSYIMKGQGNELNYPKELANLRQPGDIDVYLEGGYNKVIDYVNRTYPTCQVNELEIHYNCFKDVEVEIHYKPFSLRNPFKNSRLQHFLKSESEACFSNKVLLNTGEEIVVSTTRFNLVHQMVHIYHHLFTEGIGLRQLMDYYYLLKHNVNAQEEMENAVKVLTELGLSRFTSAVMWVLQEVFHLDRSSMLSMPNETDGRIILNEIIRRGNFGHMGDNQAVLSNKWNSFWYVNGNALRFWRFDHWAWFWTPIWRIYHFIWRKINNYK